MNDLKYCGTCYETKLRSSFPKRGGACKACRKVGVSKMSVVRNINTYSFFTPTKTPEVIKNVLHYL